MSARALELLPEYVLGTLSPEEAKEVEAVMAASPALRGEAEEMRRAFALLGDNLAPVAPSPNVRNRILASVKAERFAPFAAPLSKYFDLAVDRVAELLRSIDDVKTEWDQGPMPGIMLMHFPGGARVATADVGFVKLPKGLHFPWHRHTGFEVNFVLKGTVRDYDGRLYGPGEAIEKDANTEHEFFVDDEDVIVGVVIESGFDIIPKPDTN